MPELNDIYQISDGNREIKRITNSSNKPIWKRAVDTVDTTGMFIPTRSTGLISETVSGYCEQATTPTPSAPVDIVCNNGTVKWDSVNQRIYVDGTSEALTVSGINLANPAYYQGGGWYVSSNDTVSTANSNGTLLFPCKPNTTYSWWHTDGAGGGRAFELSTDTVTLGQEASWAVGNPAYNDAMTVRKYTTSADAKLLCVLFARVDAERVGRTIEAQLGDFMLVEGDITTATTYEPYVAPHTASVENLFAVDEYKDTHELITGLLTHKIGIKVFDGTENIGTSNACFTTVIKDRATSKTVLLCSHFPYSNKISSQTEDMTIISFSSSNIGFRYDACSDETAFATYLAEQYAAGTPVIAMYPLATETTESVTPQSLTCVHDVTNIVTLTSNYIDVTNQSVSTHYYGED